MSPIKMSLRNGMAVLSCWIDCVNERRFLSLSKCGNKESVIILAVV